MKAHISIIYVLLISLCALSCIDKTVETADAKLITAQELNDILELEDAQVVDVRTPKEFNEIHIESAQNIDFRSPTFDEDITKLDKSKPVILYCKSGQRSAKCAAKLKNAGFEKVYELEGGISKWKHSDKININEKS